MDSMPGLIREKEKIRGLMMKYFVLKPAGDTEYHKASRHAMETYADVIEIENPELARELRAWAGKEYSEHCIRTGKDKRL